jgi:hypothetical protein
LDLANTKSLSCFDFILILIAACRTEFDFSIEIGAAAEEAMIIIYFASQIARKIEVALLVVGLPSF